MLQLGNNGTYSPGDSWIAALYWCQGPSDPCYYGTTTMSVSVGDDLTGTVFASNCSAGKCDWTIEFADNTTTQIFDGTLTAGRPTNGQTNDTYTVAFGGALETYNLTTCDQFPSGGFTFSNFTTQNELGSITPSFGSFNVGLTVSPQCGYGGTLNVDGSVTLADSATTALQTSISGPASVANGASGSWGASTPTWPHAGTSPYTYSWSGILTGSGSSISGVPSGSGNLSVQVRDAAGASYTASLFVTVCDPGLLTC